MPEVRIVRVDQIKRSSRNAKTHSRRQICQIADSIREFGFVVPLLLDENGILIAGEGRWRAAQELHLRTVPAIYVSGLSPAKKRALALADNKIAENSGWDRERLAIEIAELSELLLDEGLDIAVTGFEAVEVDQLHADFGESESDFEDQASQVPTNGPLVTQVGDLWRLGGHRLGCGDARSERD